MSRLVELAQKLVKLESETNAAKATHAKLESETNAAKAELVSLLENAKVDNNVVVKRAPRKKAPVDSTAPPTVATDATKRPSLKEIVQTILGKSSEGLDLKGIVAAVHDMVQRKEYVSNAKSLSAVVSQAVNSLKGENKIQHDRESKKYSLAAA